MKSTSISTQPLDLKTSDVIKIENWRQILTFDPKTFFLTKVEDKETGKTEKLEFQVGAYPTLAGQNGAYIFMRDPEKTAGLNMFDIADVTGWKAEPEPEPEPVFISFYLQEVCIALL